MLHDELYPEILREEAFKALTPALMPVGNQVRMLDGSDPRFAMLTPVESAESATRLSTIPTTQRLAQKIMLDACGEQYLGEESDPISGRIHGGFAHEIRTEDDRQADKQAGHALRLRLGEGIFGDAWNHMPGGTGKFANYHSVLATPINAKALGAMVFQAREFERHAVGKTLSMGPLGAHRPQLDELEFAFEASVAWMSDRIKRSDIGHSIDSIHSNPHSAWLEIRTNSALHLLRNDRERMNTDDVHSPLEPLAPAFDAYMLHARLGELEGLPEKAAQSIKQANDIRNTVLRYFLLEDHHGIYPSNGLSRDRDGNPQPQQILTARAAASLLNSDIFKGPEYRGIVESIIERIFLEKQARTGKSTFLTLGGMVSVSSQHRAVQHHLDPHWSNAVRPDVNLSLIEGLYHHGFAELAFELETRLFCLMTVYGGFPDVIYLDDNERVLMPVDMDRILDVAHVIEADAMPVEVFVPNAVGTLAALHNHHTRRKMCPQSPAKEQQILSMMSEHFREKPSILIRRLRERVLPTVFMIPDSQSFTAYLMRKTEEAGI